MRKLLAVIAILSFFGMMERSVFAQDTATEIASLQAQIERLKSMVSIASEEVDKSKKSIYAQILEQVK